MRFLVVQCVFVDDNAGMIATGHMLSIANGFDQFTFDEYYGGIGCFAARCHNDFFLFDGWRQRRQMIAVFFVICLSTELVRIVVVGSGSSVVAAAAIEIWFRWLWGWWRWL